MNRSRSNSAPLSVTQQAGVLVGKRGAEMVHANLQPGGTTSGVIHGVGRLAGGAALLSGAGALPAIGMGVADLGMQAFRDMHNMTSPEVDTAMTARQNSFTNDQWNSAQDIRRKFTFAKAANPAHPSVNPNVSDDAMRGGHLVVEDAGHMDALLRVRENNGQLGGDRRGPNKPSYNLPSSHYPGSAAQQSELQMPSTDQMNFGTALHGTTPAGNSWVQMEAHSGVWSSSGGVSRMGPDYALHATDFARHKATGKQVGPLGTSPVMENNPLTVTRQDITRSRIATAAANVVRARTGLNALTPLG